MALKDVETINAILPIHWLTHRADHFLNDNAKSKMPCATYEGLIIVDGRHVPFVISQGIAMAVIGDSGLYWIKKLREAGAKFPLTAGEMAEAELVTPQSRFVLAEILGWPT